MSGFLVLLTQASVYFAAMAFVFRVRTSLGMGVFFCTLGAMHFLETYLAAVYFIQLPFGLISPGSTVMFAGKLAFFLLLYIKEDAESMRQPTYGLLIGNLLMVVLALPLNYYSDPAQLAWRQPEMDFINQIGFLMVWGTALLFIDLIGMVLLFERLGTIVTNTILGRMFISLAIVLSFDQLFFYLGLYLVTGAPLSAFYGGWIAKIGSALFFSAMLALYLRFVEKSPVPVGVRCATDVFDRLTYRHRYEKLVGRIGKDPLTGLQDRGQLDEKGPAMLTEALKSALPLSLMMIDIDHFKAVNDNHGHAEGDRILQAVADALLNAKREGDELFRYGGEEFALLCPEASAGAFMLAERMRAAVANTLHPELNRSVTVSIGIATCPTNATDFRELLMLADAALYEAKAQGRDRVSISTATAAGYR